MTTATKELGRGERILEILVDMESDGLYSGSTWVGDLVRKIEWAYDGRSLSRPLRKLETAGLIERDTQPSRQRYYWRATARGREVDAILRTITAARGGKFHDRAASGINFYESSALR